MIKTTSQSDDTNPTDPLATKELTDTFFRRLRQLWFDCGEGVSKHEEARVLIRACMEEGLVNGKRIVGVLAHLGFDRRHAGLTLGSLCGSNPARHDWWRDENGRYHLHPDPVNVEAAEIIV